MKFDLICPDCGTILFKTQDATGIKGWCPFCRDCEGNARVFKTEECEKIQ